MDGSVRVRGRFERDGEPVKRTPGARPGVAATVDRYLLALLEGKLLVATAKHAASSFEGAGVTMEAFVATRLDDLKLETTIRADVDLACLHLGAVRHARLLPP
jgi:hypothetical protein